MNVNDDDDGTFLPPFPVFFSRKKNGCEKDALFSFLGACILIGKSDWTGQEFLVGF